jgi:hypothetical protein
MGLMVAANRPVVRSMSPSPRWGQARRASSRRQCSRCCKGSTYRRSNGMRSPLMASSLATGASGVHAELPCARTEGRTTPQLLFHGGHIHRCLASSGTHRNPRPDDRRGGRRLAVLPAEQPMNLRFVKPRSHSKSTLNYENPSHR